MGKKDNMEGGGSLFSAYLAAIPEPISAAGEEDKYLPDSMKASTLLEQIGAERSWSSRDIEKDVDVLERNRLYTIKDLRVLSLQSWKEVELLPLVKDLLRQAVNPAIDYGKQKRDKKKAKNEKKQRKKKEKKLKKEKLSLKGKEGTEKKDVESKGGEAPATEEGLVTIHKSSKENKEKGEGDEESSSSSSSSSSDSDSDSDWDSDPEMKANTPKVLSSQLSFAKPSSKSSLLPGPGRIQPMGNRIRVTATNGTTYEVDRYCPHKYVDLATKGVVVGNTLFCNKHNWAFALDNKGYCSKHGMTINACKVEW
ncbi:hypothetical protein BC939DRAFT_505081 [Gamsiella multidivaricata]|uniref:uncharacterized protein n=1 Tax=Gamsiella multidivaricata TaxID=101098 RepID=UPI002220F195|nr:uncharacterized protein BC939DRAFT_505081 [Gamsiella multidivaricata]KAI7820237.1 hypothetical protein BC939DRAFT_505081 [Gamsiella multidivaricata]